MRRLPSPPLTKEAKQARLRRLKRVLLLSALFCVFFATIMCVTAFASDFSITVDTDSTEGNLGALEIIFLFAFIGLLPSIIMMMSSFTRIIIVLSFLRSALGTNQSPPNMVLIGLAFFLSLFIMADTLGEMNTVAYQPYVEGQLTSTQALDAAQTPLKKFMLTQINGSSLEMFVNLANVEPPDYTSQEALMELPLTVIIPAFITSELSRAFLMGFLIFLPFLVIDLVVSSILMSMGMVMLPPAMIALPFKILLFVMVDGWNLMMGTLVNSFIP